MSIYQKIIVVEKYDKDSNKSIWKLLILHKKGGKWVDFTSIKFNSWLKANAYKENIEQAIDINNLSVEKLQEQLNTAKKYIEHAIGTIKHDGHLGTIQTDWILPDLEKALAEIGGDDE
ncbi:ORF118a [Lactococcus cremoris]|uniref:Uncharacterized protein n=1 Tax=Lactococcus lactis subsp. cremoris TaxID=1359 RepID=A0AAD1JWU0_LACLC|nr:hypothetical protein [Lactococcus cremoris]BBC76069.1 ORF118a [Lactococcus cremoris]BCO02187.1 hypothetical protein LLG32_02810 [Lactococcus cremoris]BCO05151.1 hypothetical protein LLC_03910 [Lactococcus cremoris]